MDSSKMVTILIMPLPAHRWRPGRRTGDRFESALDPPARPAARPPTLGAVELVLVRHGEPEWVRAGFNVDDPPLTPRGREQARLLADRLVQERFDEAYVSPMTRARETAAPVFERL